MKVQPSVIATIEEIAGLETVHHQQEFARSSGLIGTAHTALG
jgi:hypothetical protein